MERRCVSDGLVHTKITSRGAASGTFLKTSQTAQLYVFERNLKKEVPVGLTTETQQSKLKALGLDVFSPDIQPNKGHKWNARTGKKCASSNQTKAQRRAKVEPRYLHMSFPGAFQSV